MYKENKLQWESSPSGYNCFRFSRRELLCCPDELVFVVWAASVWRSRKSSGMLTRKNKTLRNIVGLQSFLRAVKKSYKNQNRDPPPPRTKRRPFFSQCCSNRRFGLVMLLWHSEVIFKVRKHLIQIACVCVSMCVCVHVCARQVRWITSHWLNGYQTVPHPPPWWKPLHSPVVGEPNKHPAQIIQQFPSLWRAARDGKVRWGHWGRWLQGGGGQYYTQWKLLQSNRCSWCVPPDVNIEMNKRHLIKKWKKKEAFCGVINLCSGKPSFPDYCTCESIYLFMWINARSFMDTNSPIWNASNLD